MSSERAGTHTGGALNREKVEALVDEGDIYLAEFEATDSWGSGGFVPAREQAVTRFLDALEACVVPDPRVGRIEALLAEPLPPNSFYINGMPDQYAALAEFYDEDFAKRLRAILRGDQ